MKKYNLSKIMKRAWELVKNLAATMSEALKQAWKEAKQVKEKFTGVVKILKAGCEGYEYAESNWFVFKSWKKNNLFRIYVNDYKGRSVGYIDGLTKKIYTEYSDNSNIHREMECFIEKYDF